MPRNVWPSRSRGSTSFTPLPQTGSNPTDITTGSDGALWFTEAYANKIGRLTTGGTLTEYDVPTADSRPYGIAAGSDGNLWFGEQAANKIGQVSVAGFFEEFPIPADSSSVELLAPGPDEAIWFVEGNVQQIGRIGISSIPPTPVRTPPVLSLRPRLTPRVVTRPPA